MIKGGTVDRSPRVTSIKGRFGEGIHLKKIFEQQAENCLFVSFETPERLEEALSLLSSMECQVSVAGEIESDDHRSRGLEKGSFRPVVTERETDVLLLLAKGMSYHEIALLIDCKISTVQTHVKRIYKKMEVHSRSEAVHEAVQLNIIQL